MPTLEKKNERTTFSRVDEKPRPQKEIPDIENIFGIFLLTYVQRTLSGWNWQERKLVKYRCISILFFGIHGRFSCKFNGVIKLIPIQESRIPLILPKNNGEFARIYFIYNFRRFINILGEKGIKKFLKLLFYILLTIQHFAECHILIIIFFLKIKIDSLQ